MIDAFGSSAHAHHRQKFMCVSKPLHSPKQAHPKKIKVPTLRTILTSIDQLDTYPHMRGDHKTMLRFAYNC